MKLKELLKTLTPLTPIIVTEHQPDTYNWIEIVNDYKCDIIHKSIDYEEYNQRIYNVTINCDGVLLVRVFKVK